MAEQADFETFVKRHTTTCKVMTLFVTLEQVILREYKEFIEEYGVRFKNYENFFYVKYKKDISKEDCKVVGKKLVDHYEYISREFGSKELTMTCEEEGEFGSKELMMSCKEEEEEGKGIMCALVYYEGTKIWHHKSGRFFFNFSDKDKEDVFLSKYVDDFFDLSNETHKMFARLPGAMEYGVKSVDGKWGFYVICEKGKKEIVEEKIKEVFQNDSIHFVSIKERRSEKEPTFRYLVEIEKD